MQQDTTIPRGRGNINDKSKWCNSCKRYDHRRCKGCECPRCIEKGVNELV